MVCYTLAVAMTMLWLAWACIIGAMGGEWYRAILREDGASMARLVVGIIAAALIGSSLGYHWYMGCIKRMLQCIADTEKGD